MKLTQEPRYINRYTPYDRPNEYSEPYMPALDAQKLFDENSRISRQYSRMVLAIVTDNTFADYDADVANRLVEGGGKKYIRDTDEVEYLKPITDKYLKGEHSDLRVMYDNLKIMMEYVISTFTGKKRDQYVIAMDVTASKIKHIINLSAISEEM